MKKILTVFGILFISFGLLAQDAKEIIRKVDDKMQGNSNESVMTMTIVRPKYTRTVEFKNWSLGREYFMTLVTAPSKDKGQVFMKLNTEMWTYTPSINRLIKLPPSMMSQGWMGSDYSNDDLVKQSSIVNDYSHKLLGEENIDGKVCYRIEMIPHENSDIVWGKVLTYVDKDLLVNLKTEYFDEEDYLVRSELGKDIKNFGGRDLPSIIEIIPADEPENKTIISIISMQFDVEMNESFFTQQNMKRVR